MSGIFRSLPDVERSLEECEAEVDRLKKYERFVQHIQAHLRPDQHVICKICGKSVDEVANLEGKP